MCTQKHSILNDLPLVLTVTQVSQVLQISRRIAYGLIKSGELLHIRVGKQIRVYRGALEEYIKKNS